MRTITNRLGYRVIESDLVYPLGCGYKLLAKLDAEFVLEELEREFQAKRINNKYVILMPNGQLWYQHDNHTWLIEEVEDIPDCVLGGFECNQEIRE